MHLELNEKISSLRLRRWQKKEIFQNFGWRSGVWLKKINETFLVKDFCKKVSEMTFIVPFLSIKPLSLFPRVKRDIPYSIFCSIVKIRIVCGTSLFKEMIFWNLMLWIDFFFFLNGSVFWRRLDQRSFEPFKTTKYKLFSFFLLQKIERVEFTW